MNSDEIVVGILCQQSVCVELAGKKSESVKLPLQSVKKNVLKFTANIEQNSKTSLSSKKDTISSFLKEKKISEKSRRSGEVNEERKHKHCDRTKHLHCTKSESSKPLVKGTLKKHGLVHVDSQLIEQDEKKKLDHHGDVIQEHSVPDCPDGMKKLKLCDTGRKLDKTYVETKVCRNNLEECQSGNSGGLQYASRKELRDDSSKLQLLEKQQRTDDRVVHMMTETGGTEVVADRDGKRADVHKQHNAKKNEHSKDSARQHVCRGLYRALSSRYHCTFCLLSVLFSFCCWQMQTR